MEQKVNLEEPSQVVPIDKDHIMVSSVFVHPRWNCIHDLRAETKISCNNGHSNYRITITAKIPRLTINKVSVLAQGSLAGSCVHEAMCVQLQRLGCKVECITIKTKLTDRRSESTTIFGRIYLATWIKGGRQWEGWSQGGWVDRTGDVVAHLEAHCVSQIFFSLFVQNTFGRRTLTDPVPHGGRILVVDIVVRAEVADCHLNKVHLCNCSPSYCIALMLWEYIDLGPISIVESSASPQST